MLLTVAVVGIIILPIASKVNLSVISGPPPGLGNPSVHGNLNTILGPTAEPKFHPAPGLVVPSFF